MTELTGRQKRHLRSLGHHLSECVTVGSGGITEGVVRELAGALDVHELVKVRLGPGCTLERKEAACALGAAADAAVAQVLGKTVLLYRPGPKSAVSLP